MAYERGKTLLSVTPVSQPEQSRNGRFRPTKVASERPSQTRTMAKKSARRSQTYASHPAPASGTIPTNAKRQAQELREITTLYNVAVAVGSSLNIQEVLWTLYKESSRLIDTANFALAIYDEGTDTLNFVLAFDRGRRIKPFAVRMSKHAGLAGKVLASQSPLLIQGAGATSPLAAQDVPKPNKQNFSTMQPTRSWLGVPILNPVLNDEEVQGVIATWSYEPNKFTEHDLWLLSALGTQAAIAIRNARLYETVLAERDRVLEIEEETRRALARDLHDGPTQLVSAMLMRLEFCQMVFERDPSKLVRELTAVQELARQAVHEIRTLLFELRPLILETQGLAAALQTFIERRQADIAGGTRLTLAIKPIGPDSQISRHDSKTEQALFAVVQEAVNNAIKHAQASEIKVELGETEAASYVMIADDGCGFEVEQVMSRYEQRGSLGMVNIRERAALIGGDLVLQTKPGQGTRLAVWVPKAETERTRKRGATGPLSLPRQMRPER